MDDVTRRRVLRASGIVAVGALAGCAGDDGGDGAQPTIDGSEYPSINEWLGETEGAPGTTNYDGSLIDLTGEDTVTVDVGAEGNTGNFAFGPPGIVISAGTEVEWSWTGEGNPHNVEAIPEEQLGESDYTFSSGEAVGGSGVQYSRSFEDPGIALYHCEPHLSLGMKGGIAIQ
jgi:halocyanin-like protein